MNFSTIIRRFFAIIWIIYCLIGISTNCTHYTPADWIIMIILFISPFAIYIAIKKRNISNSDNRKLPINTQQEILEDESCPIHLVPTIHQTHFTSPDNIDLLFNIPDEVANLLWIKGQNIIDNEPSMIDTSLLISDVITEQDNTTDYYPSYKKLSPAQRYIYLKWLEDISKPINIGYVFLFYYGLERHLFLGDFDNAYKMIEILRRHHDNNSFQQYSSDALLMSIVYHGRYDLMQNISFDCLGAPVKFYLKHKLNIPITSDDIIDSCREFGFTNTRYIKENRDYFKELLDKKLYEMYGQSAFKFTDDDFKNATNNCPLVLANYLLTNRFVVMPDITTNTQIANMIFCILSSIHEEYKSLKRLNSKTTK